MSKNKALSLRLQWLGEHLRNARRAAGYTLEQTAEYLQVRHVTLSRFENGHFRPKPSYVRDLIDFYGVVDEKERAILLQLNEDAGQKDWLLRSADGFATEFIDYTWVEGRARTIHAFSPMLIHGLLQTEDYARALTSAGMPVDTPESTIERLVEVRLARQEVLYRHTPVHLSVALEQKPLTRDIGGATVMRQQLMHLLKLQRHENIELRVLRDDVGWHPGLNGPFTYFDMPDPYPNVAYFEGLIGRTFLEEESKVDTYRKAYDVLRDLTFTPQRSGTLIRETVKDLE